MGKWFASRIDYGNGSTNQSYYGTCFNLSLVNSSINFLVTLNKVIIKSFWSPKLKLWTPVFITDMEYNQMKRLKRFGSIMLSSLMSSGAFAASNIDTTDKYAWNENSGWMNFNDTNGGVTVIYNDHLEGYAWLENIGWIRLGTYTGGGTHSYTNDSNTNYGVNNDGSGNLSGYAWSETAGWINFNPDHSQVTLNATTGDFDSYAWSENIGWIHFQNASPAYKVQYKILNAPTSLSGSAASQTQINLSWADNSDNEAGFKIERSTGALIPSTAIDATSYSDSGLSCGSTYNYSVKATNGSGESSATTTNASTLTCPPTTYNLTVSKTGNGTINGTGISCGSDCQENIVLNTNTTLTATPDDGWLFSAWGG